MQTLFKPCSLRNNFPIQYHCVSGSGACLITAVSGVKPVELRAHAADWGLLVHWVERWSRISSHWVLLKRWGVMQAALTDEPVSKQIAQGLSLMPPAPLITKLWWKSICKDIHSAVMPFWLFTLMLEVIIYLRHVMSFQTCMWLFFHRKSSLNIYLFVCLLHVQVLLPKVVSEI